MGWAVLKCYSTKSCMALQGVLKPFGRLARLLKILQDPECPEGPEILKNILKKKNLNICSRRKNSKF